MTENTGIRGNVSNPAGKNEEVELCGVDFSIENVQEIVYDGNTKYNILAINEGLIIQVKNGGFEEWEKAKKAEEAKANKGIEK